jgi:hypothetical protein
LDIYCILHALEVTKSTIVPHVEQLISIMDTSLPSQRMKLNADDVLGPLEMMYEFGELESAGSLDKIPPPIVLFGENTIHIGQLHPTFIKSTGWRTLCIDDSLHSVLEGCEPITGMR